MRSFLTIVAVLFVLAPWPTLGAQRRVKFGFAGPGYTVLHTTTGTYGMAAIRAWSAYYPEMADLSAQPIIVGIHGGGWTSGSREGDTDINLVAPEFARLGYIVYSIDYTLATDIWPTPSVNATQFPAPQQDVRAFLGYLGEGSGLGGNKNKITMWGNSVGSQLAMDLALAPKATWVESEHPSTDYTIVAALSQCTPTDLLTMYNTCTGGTACQQPIFDHLGYDPNTNAAAAALASPQHWVTSSSIAIYLQQGDADPLVPFLQASDMNAVYVAAGATMSYVIYPGVGHSANVAWTNLYNYVWRDRQQYVETHSR